MNTKEYTLPEDALRDICTCAVYIAIETLGLSSGEISTSEARKRYGAIFTYLVSAGKLHPTRVGSGKTGTRWYRVADITRLIAEERSKARIQLQSVNK